MTNAVDEAHKATSQKGTAKRRSKWPGVLLCLGIMLILGWILEINFQISNRVLRSLFGPPSVTMRETYEEKPDALPFDHSTFDKILKAHVDRDGWVDYARVKADQNELNQYLEQISQADLDLLDRNERLAFLLNAYNAFTLKLIIERYPLQSIKDIPASQRWDDERWVLGGEIVSLGQIEHSHIRPHFIEPRIHFALVCAAVGCPPLRNEAYTGSRLETQLTAQTTYVHNHTTWFRYSAPDQQLQLTPLYNWYRGDFLQVAGGLPEYAAAYSSALAADLRAHRAPQIDWLPYDWTLNDSENRAPR